MVGKNSLYWQFIRQNKLSNNSQFRDDKMSEIVKQLNKKVKSRTHYNFKLSHKFLIGKIYRTYTKAFCGFKKGHGPITIIGKVSKSGNCEYPNTFWYRITKAWRYL